MIKSLKGQFILSILVAICFIYNSFNYTKFTGEGEFHFSQFILYLVMIFSVYNAGILTQKYINQRKSK
ncbi:hypothetical protein [Neobacillus sp. 114]|uniref:hypothetical protein n=1 Tax=Neobacillus sp. 114 TaxID=3048535 RepID=UPI001C2120AD|nr:hypothetical protein [Neobacillus sp. 114]MBU8919288.1 hypothetical protein [Bacillus sp. FJAT-29953]